MKNNLTTFSFGTNEVRTVTIDGEPWFVAKDICDVLDITTDQTRRLDADDKVLYPIQTLGGNQNMTIINESGLYSLIMTSRKPEAKAFKKWVTSEVLPAIRKTGTYSVSQPVQEPKRDLISTPLELQQNIIAVSNITTEQYPTLNPNTIQLMRDWAENKLVSICGQNVTKLIGNDTEQNLIIGVTEIAKRYLNIDIPLNTATKVGKYVVAVLKASNQENKIKKVERVVVGEFRKINAYDKCDHLYIAGLIEEYFLLND